MQPFATWAAKRHPHGIFCPFLEGDVVMAGAYYG